MLYEELRPKTLDDIIGQHEALALLKRIAARAAKHQTPVALLITGPSGCGKTSAAHALAHTLNPDTWATSTLDARTTDLLSCKDMEYGMHLHPAKGSWKTYIIDEIHTISNPAASYLLGLLERLPPRRAIIGTTTEPEPFDATLRSRWINLDMHQPDTEDATKLIKRACTLIGTTPPPDAAIRDAISRRQHNLRRCITDLAELGKQF